MVPELSVESLDFLQLLEEVKSFDLKQLGPLELWAFGLSFEHDISSDMESSYFVEQQQEHMFDKVLEVIHWSGPHFAAVS